MGRQMGMPTAAWASTGTRHQKDRERGTTEFPGAVLPPASSLPLPPFPPELATYWYTHLPHRATVLPEFPHLFLITS